MTTTNPRAAAVRSPLDHDPAELRRRRVATGRTLLDVAKQIGISYSYLSELERGTRNPSPPMLGQIAEALDCSITDLMAKPAAAKAS